MSDRVNLVAPASPIECLTASILLHRLVLLSVCFIYPMSGRYSTKVDPARKLCTLKGTVMNQTTHLQIKGIHSVYSRFLQSTIIFA